MGEEHRFRAVVEAARGGGAVALIPPEVGAALGGNRQMRVTGSLQGTPFRSSTMPYRGALYVGVHKATREAAGVAIGDQVEIAVVRDDSPRVLDLGRRSGRAGRGGSAPRPRLTLGHARRTLRAVAVAPSNGQMTV
jgi:hypothetical protein